MSSDSNHRKTFQSIPNENDFDTSSNHIPSVPSRAPLNSIPDPSQYHLHQSHDPSIASATKKSDGIVETHLLLKTPKFCGRGKLTISETNSAQTTPIRSGPRVSNIGVASGSTLTRLPSQLRNGGGRGGPFPRVSRGISVVIPQQILVDVPHFELDDDRSFWNDRNVQVLIRIRPLNNSELISQGHGRCLRQESGQTVVWLGHPETRFTFDHVACESISQDNLFRVAGLPMVDNCMSGYNSCMFAYGQTGSGKTYTMMGEIDKMDGKLSDDCGITPRIFEYLFTRITKEEESRKQERLIYSCKCSFLEIYNEHITDLLEPSSTNLLLREDSKSGVYVENLTEHSVRTVNDVLQLLQQGAANRKIAATHMNSESSRSHSVFTCVIESRWEKDSMAHLRFGRLNLVDLAGSERQKSSGAEGDRLKEAANINKSLSTLGLVIMSLVDVAQGKHRHVPYRDSRLTFLLQDSLGGNSKTTIIANVSSSICSANETLSTLKFAQRAKLIQNNAKINEDASTGVIALQLQIQQLKDQLSFLMKHQHTSMEFTDIVPRPEQSSLGNFSESPEPFEKINIYDENKIPKGRSKKNKRFKAILHGVLRREKLAETEVRRLKTEIEHFKCLAHQLEEETQHDKMILKFREEKINCLELLIDGLVSDDKFYLDNNNALREENLLLQAKIERNPEVIRLGSENIRLLEQIRLFQDFYEKGERETLLAEISELRNQLLESVAVEESSTHHQLSPVSGDQELEVANELQCCKDMNSKLIREVDELRGKLIIRMNSNQDPLHSCDNAHKQLMDAQPLTEALKLEQFQLIEELESVQTKNQHLMKMLDNEEVVQRKLEDFDIKLSGSGKQDPTSSTEGSEGTSIFDLQTKLEKLSKDLKQAQIFNREYVEDNPTLISQDQQTELVRDEVGMETTRTTIHLQEERDRLQSEFQVSLCSMAEQNLILKDTVAAKEIEIRVLCEGWERATLELTTFLINGSRSLVDASREISSISSLFPNTNNWISEHVEKAAKISVGKEETILLLQKSLENAQNTVMQMEQKLYSLKGAAIALTEFQQPEDIQLSRTTNDSTEVKEFREDKDISKKDQITDNQGKTPMLVENRTSNSPTSGLRFTVAGNLPLLHTNAFATTDGENEVIHDEIQFSLRENTNTLSLVEECFLATRTDVEQLFATARADAIQVVAELQVFFCRLRSPLEELICNAMQNDISILVLQCQMGEYSHKFRRPNELVADNLEQSYESQDVNSALQPVKLKEYQIACVPRKEIQELDPVDGDTVDKNSELKRELERKDVLLKGLLFDFSLLQEFASHRKDIKDELDKLIVAMNKVQHELQVKRTQHDDTLIQNKKLEGRLFEAEQALSNSNSELNQTRGALHILSEQNVELKDLLKDLYLKNSYAEQLIEDQREVIKSLDREVIRDDSSPDKRLFHSVEDTEVALAESTSERDELVEKLTSLQYNLDMVSALADENQAIAAEARQESETRKLYAEQKEEEVKILEHSVEELESTINVLEKKVNEMEEEVEKQRLIRDSLEVELQALRHRLLTVEDLTESMASETSSTSLLEDHFSRKSHARILEINEAGSRIRFLEEENKRQAKEIRQFKDYISELVLHAEAQASQYQHKYKTLEAMLHEVKPDLSNVSATSTVEKVDKISARTRGSSSPFRCISGLVQHMNQEKDQELASARLHIEELEALAASRYKEVCMLNTRLANTESMTHDVIRDLLSVKLDITNYANIVDQHQLQKLIEEAQHYRQEFVAMEQELSYLRSQIDDLLEERDRYISEIKRNKADQLGTQIVVEQLRERDQLLIAQNDMLKMDKSNLQKRVAELDGMVKRLFSMKEAQRRNQPQTGSSSVRPFDYDLGERLVHSQKALSRINNQLAQYRRPDGTYPDENKVKRKQKP
ncbi:hypothetical protein ABFX02_07G000900 [Erythranthe guttata]|uniref:phragmoplast orienting kinesin-1-like isoform X2 n=1 Tax=Erythranthe guttata TaxID=4155 RepID=UPI00064DEFDE|nr:PREDICTED: phragmoplast orienting kinesin-1-like isoform X2 [Erythranthe guttata]|eukprot:XP_012850768.1 PREDICTED: phragmoplast orienting kinesin-1-like isoform X2 [Erythranthe guttata]